MKLRKTYPCKFMETIQMHGHVNFVVATEGVDCGRFVLVRARKCPSCGAGPYWQQSPDSGTIIKCYPGSWPVCQKCGAKIMCWGRTPIAPCVSPNGRVDGHNSYVAVTRDGVWVCAFCKKPTGLTVKDPKAFRKAHDALGTAKRLGAQFGRHLKSLRRQATRKEPARG